MRQSKTNSELHKNFRRMALLVTIFVLFGAHSLFADVTSAELTVTPDPAPAPSGSIYNLGVKVTLKATWLPGDTPPFAATFQKDGVDFKSSTVSPVKEATVMVIGGELGDGPHNFGVRVVETSTGKSVGPVAGNQSVTVDTTAPRIKIAAWTPSSKILSTIGPNNVGTVTITSENKPIRPLTSADIKLSPTDANVVVTDAPGNPTTPGTFYQFIITANPGALGGVHTINVEAKDTTVPAGFENKGTLSESFTVQNDGPPAPVFTTSDPLSPTKRSYFTLTGTNASAAVKVGVYDATNTATLVTWANVTATTWSAVVQPTPIEGAHSYVVRGTDSLGNVGPASPIFTVIIDQTLPNVPQIDDPLTGKRTNLPTINIIGTGAFDLGTTQSPPIIVRLYRNGTELRNINANSDGTFTFTNVALVAGSNRFKVKAEDQAHGSRGNESTDSAEIEVIYDTAGNSVLNLVFAAAVSATFASQPLPLPATTWICPGTYFIQVTFSEPMATDTNPNIVISTTGGWSQSFNNGTWASDTVYTGSITIPAGQGVTVDGPGATVQISGAKDIAGNLMAVYGPTAGFNIDTSPPVTTMASIASPIYFGSGTANVLISGVASDSLAGVAWTRIAWEKFDDGSSPGSVTVPIFAGPVVPWSYILPPPGPGPSKWKLWVYSGDQAQPNSNVEVRNPAIFRTVYVDVVGPDVIKICFDDSLTDITQNPPYIIIASAVSKLNAYLTYGGASGIDFTRVSTQTFILRDPNGAVIDGNYTNNGVDLITFTFPTLTVNGTYTISLTVWDKANNASPVASRGFILDQTGPLIVSVEPSPSGTIVNHTNPTIALDQVWADITDTPPIVDYTNNPSSMTVTYNGIEVGNQVNAPSPLAHLTWDLYGPASATKDQSCDGRYDVVVTPRDILGNVGPVFRSNFTLDTQAPAVTLTTPASSSWIGIGRQNLTMEFSDAPADQVKYMGAKVAPDASWQNGAGSGLNIGAATGSATILGLVFPAAVSGTSTLVVDFNAVITATTTSSGLETVTMDASVPDRVTNRSPNIRRLSYPLIYDYMRPTFTFTKPLAGKKYCKLQIDMSGDAKDNGLDTTLLQIIKAEISGENQVYGPVNTTPPLPTKNASWTVTVDISSLADGNRTFYGHCFDRANNESAPNPGDLLGSPTTIAIIIDRTPPGPPTLILPLNDTFVNNRGTLFKWSKVTDAQKYLLQVSDNQGFSNILNNMTTASYPALIGNVTLQTQGSFSVPKDGMYYWRVASIEDCEDGYNIGSFSTTWRYTVDTVKPKALEVQPTPSTGNKVTTGMVTFTIRFNEKMDVTKVPTVSVTSAGGEYMKVEQVTYKDNTWTGTTVIPKNNSALYDGNAIISISVARDIAGNEMETDTTHQIIINTGPAFETKIFSNPAHEYELVIVTRSTEALQGPPTCSVSQGGARVPIPMNFLKEKYYAGSYLIDKTISGKAFIDLTGTDLYGMVGKGSVEFTVAAVNPSIRTNIVSADKFAVLDIPQGSLAKAGALYMIPRSSVDQTTSQSPMARVAAMSGKVGVQRDIRPNPELKELMMLEELGPVSTKLVKPMHFKASIGTLDTSIPSDKINLYRQVGDGWEFCGGVLSNKTIQGDITGLGKLALMADTKAPRMLRLTPADKEKLDTPFPVFEGSFADGGSGIWPDSAKLTIDGIEQKGVVLDRSGNLTFEVKKALIRGPHQIELSVADRAGNTVRQGFSVVAPGPFAIDELMAYPNPARGDSVWITYNLQQRADEIKLKILDVSGGTIAEFDTSDFPKLSSGKIKWDLAGDDGRKVSNGAYFFKMEATKDGKTQKATRKLAVLK